MGEYDRLLAFCCWMAAGACAVTVRMFVLLARGMGVL